MELRHAGSSRNLVSRSIDHEWYMARSATRRSANRHRISLKTWTPPWYYDVSGSLSVKIVAGLSLKNLEPRITDPTSPYYLPKVSAVMVSYAEFAQMPRQRRRAMELGLHRYLGLPPDVAVYLDNGAFYFLTKVGEVPRQEYEEFVRETRPTWYPIPQDYIPTPQMDSAEQLSCLRRTMAVNCAYTQGGYVPVVHIGAHLTDYLTEFMENAELRNKPAVALGGIVPNLLRMSKAISYTMVLEGLGLVRATFADQHLHVFGIGGTATVHLAALFGIDSVDSSGWRNRAARGIVQLPGRGDRIVASLGSWRGREPNEQEWEILAACPCPACAK